MTAPFWQESKVMVSDQIDLTVTTESREWLTAMRNVTSLYADGGVFRPRRCEAGSWAWVGENRHGERVAFQRGWVEASGTLQDGVTNNLTEFAAMLKALEAITAVVPGWSGRMCSDSEITRGRFRDGWRLTGIPYSWERRMRRVMEQTGDVDFVLLKGHPTLPEIERGEGIRERSGRRYPVSRHQVLCDTLCTQTMNEWSEASGVKR